MKKAKRRSTSKRKIIYLVGEGTGETISKIARAALAQFYRENVLVKTFFLVKDEQYISRIIKHAAEDDALVAFSVVQPNLRDYLIREANRYGIKAIDVIGNFIIQLSIFLKEKPLEIPGRQYILDEDYFRRIEAINFAVKHDDGKLPQGLKDADLILIGLSRTGKTPLSTYLANQGWKVANVPVHPDMDTPSELFQLDQRKIFGLIINIESLVKLREARLEQLGLGSNAKYADPVQVADEIEWSKEFFKNNRRWRVVDVSNKAIEEVAAGIVSAYQKKRKSA
ncbi:MAG: kinase/pyrophosphorylase [Nitrospirae bacterium]|nr:kinase/pyrophosphorylase [Nitrospirota bacterium]